MLNQIVSTTSEFVKDEHLLDKYDSIMHEQLQNGIVEKVNQKDDKQVSRETLRPIHYMPHHAVV